MKEILAVCHVHSTWSYDGSWSLESLRARFAGRGYRVLMMTEHDQGFSEKRFQEFRQACCAASSADVLVVPGIEYSDPGNQIHILTWGLSSFIGENLPTLALLEAVDRSGGVAVLAHPARRKAWSAVEPQWKELLLGVEVWNRKYNGWAPCEVSRGLMSDERHVPFVGLDFHTKKQMFPLAMALQIEGEISESSVVRSLQTRQCSARLLGQPLDGQAFRLSLPMLHSAERVRKAAALAVRSARAAMVA